MRRQVLQALCALVILIGNGGHKSHAAVYQTKGQDNYVNTGYDNIYTGHGTAYSGYANDNTGYGSAYSSYDYDYNAYGGKSFSGKEKKKIIKKNTLYVPYKTPYPVVVKKKEGGYGDYIILILFIVILLLPVFLTRINTGYG